MAVKSSSNIVSVLLLLSQCYPLSVLAQEAGHSDLDLSSSNRTIMAGNDQSGTITVGGSTVTVTPGFMLTPAESVALSQVLGGGAQNLVIDAAGRAVGGQFTLSASNFANLVIPTGVTAVHDFGNSGGLNLSGNLSNSGSFYAVSSNLNLSTAIINAQNISNLQGGLLTTVLPQGGLAGFGNLFSGLSLGLNALQNISNYGVISSAGNLSMAAGGTISNLGSGALMSATQNLNIQTASLINSGAIAAQNNINIVGQLQQNLLINNIGGTISALNDINVASASLMDNLNITINGGDWISDFLHVNAGAGDLSINSNLVSGSLTVAGDTINVFSSGAQLTIANVNAGDPAFINNAGDIILDTSMTFSGQDLAIVASGNIYSTGPVSLDTSSAGGKGGSITLVAGGIIGTLDSPDPISGIPPFNGPITITGANGNPASINIDGSLNSSGSTGGNINIVAFGGDINVTGSVTAKGGGNVMVVGNGAINIGSIDSTGGTFNNSNQYANGNGNVSILAAAATTNAPLPDGSGGFSSTVVINNGTISGGFSDKAVSGGFLFDPQSGANANITVGNISTSGGNVLIRGGGGIQVQDVLAGNMGSFNTVQIGNLYNSAFVASGNVSTGAVTAHSINIGSAHELQTGALSGLGGIVSVSANSDNAFTVGGGAGANVASMTNQGFGFGIASLAISNLGTGSVIVNQALDSSVFNVMPLSPGAPAQQISITASGDISLPGLIQVGTSGMGDGGFININGKSVSFQGAADLQANAVNDGNGGTISLLADTLTASSGLSLSANGSGFGFGGNIYVGGSSNSESNLAASGTISASANGGSSGSGGGIDFLALTSPGISLSLHADGGIDGGSGGYVNIDNSWVAGADISLDSNSSVTANAYADGASAGSVWIWSGGNLSIADSSISVSSGLDGDGGFLDLRAGQAGSGSLAIAGDLAANGSGIGKGGTITVWAPSILSAGGNNLISANGGSSGNGGSILFRADDASASISGAEFSFSATGGSTGSSTGNGGTIEINAGGDLDAAGSYDLRALGQNGDGGSLTLVAGFAGISNDIYQLNSTGSLNLGSGSFDASGTGSGSAGDIRLIGAEMAASQNAVIRADGGASGGSAGEIAVSSGKSISLDAATLSARGNGASGGKISIVAGADLSITNASVNASSNSAAGGSISISAGSAGNGALTVDGNLHANGGGSAKAGAISLSQNASSIMQLGLPQAGGQGASGVISASNANGSAGTLSISNSSSQDLNIQLNQSIRLEGQGSALGELTLSAQGSDIDLQGPGAVSAELSASGSSISFDVSGAGTRLGLNNIESTAGDLTLRASASDSSLVFASGSELSAAGGAIELASPHMEFQGDASIAMDNAGLLRIHSGNASSSLSLNLADGATLSFNLEQGTSPRPGLVEIGPTNAGGISITSSGAATIDFQNSTASFSSINGSIDLSSGVSISSDAFDSSQNLGIELIANSGDINLNSNISARQIDLSTIAGGNVNLGSDLIAPTVRITVEGNSSINQSGSGSIGIGTLVLNSQNGDIGSAANPLEANVLELQVNSQANAFINNASSVDLRTSNVAGSYQLVNDGDVSILSSVTAGNLSLSANGDISIDSNVNGVGGAVLAAAGSGAAVQINSGSELRSSAGSVVIAADILNLSGAITASGAASQVSINSNSGSLSLAGSGGSISAGGLIDINGSDSVQLSANYTMNAGPSGQVQIRTSSVSTSGVSLTNGAQLSATGGSQLNIMTNALAIGAGSSISGSHGANAVTVQSSAGANLAVTVGSLSTSIASGGGGAVSFLAGLGGELSFSRQGGQTGSSADLNITGGNLNTSSTAADTSLNNVNLNSDRNITIAVNGASLNLNGNISSSLNNGVIVLQDPDGITISGSGAVGFVSGSHGSIMVQAHTENAELRFAGNPRFNAGAGGSVSFSATGLIDFQAGSTVAIGDGASLAINAPRISFGAQGQVLASGASNISLGGFGASGVDIVLPDSSSGTISTNGGGLISIATSSGAPINFVHNDSGSASATLNLHGAPVTIQTNNADVTIESNVIVHADNNVSVLTPGGTFVNDGQLQTPTQGSTTIIEAAGPLFINENVQADSLIVRTTANNGNITLGANLTVTNNLSVSADGSGNIYQTNGLLSAASISLTSGSGNIGSSKGAIQVSTKSLTVSTSGSAHVNAQGSVRLESYNVGAGLHLSAGGNIAIGAENAQVININSSGVFNAGANGVVSITASEAINVSSGVRLRVNDSSLQMSAGQINLADARVNAESDLSISGAISGTNFVLRSREGELNISGNVSGQDFRLNSWSDLNINGQLSGDDFRLVSRNGDIQASGAISGDEFSIRSKAGDITLGGALSGRNINISTGRNGDIVFGASAAASNELHVSAGGSGDIIQKAGILSAHSMVLDSGTGNIGSSRDALDVSSGELRLDTQRNGLVNINAQGNLTLLDSRSGGDFSLKASGNLNVNDIETNHGSIYLQGHGQVRVEKGSHIQANQGNLTIINSDLKNGQITIGKNSELIALSNSSRNGLGNVYISIGDLPKKPVEGRAPKGLQVSEKWGGNAYFGANGITVKGSGNEVNAWGSNVVFNTGSRSASAITLEGGVYILADPPPEASPVDAGAGTVSSAAASQAFITSLLLPSLQQMQSFNTVNTVNFNSFNPSSSLLGASQKTQGKQLQTASKNGAGNDASGKDGEMLPIACVTAVTDATIKAASHELQRICNNSGISIAGSAVYENNTLSQGELIVSARRHVLVNAGKHKVSVKPGACVVIKSNGSGLEVFNVYEGHWASVKVSINGKDFLVGSGQKLLHGQESDVAVRNETVHRAEDRDVRIGEFPLVSLMAKSELLPRLMRSKLKEDKQLAARLFKMAACLSVVTGSHGAYKD